MKDWQRIVDYLSDLATEDERKALEDWMNRSEANRQYFEKVKRIWETAAEPDATFQPDATKAWGKMQQAMGNQPMWQTHKTLGTSRNKVFPFPTIWKVAAAVAVLMVIGTFLFSPWSQTKTVVTKAGENQEITLADGTTVWLNEHSTFTYPKTFSGQERLVNLEGEAFFEVTKNPAKPFKIHTPSSRTTVLGTSFELSDREKMETAEIVVVTGKVVFGDSSNTVTLLPGKKAVLHKRDKDLTTSTNVDKNFMAWKTHQLIFDHIPFEEVLVVMEGYFDVEIEVTNPNILSCPFTGNYKNPTLEELITVFELGANLKVTQKNGTYIVAGNGCGTKKTL